MHLLHLHVFAVDLELVAGGELVKGHTLLILAAQGALGLLEVHGPVSLLHLLALLLDDLHAVLFPRGDALLHRAHERVRRGLLDESILKGHLRHLVDAAAALRVAEELAVILRHAELLCPVILPAFVRLARFRQADAVLIHKVQDVIHTQR